MTPDLELYYWPTPNGFKVTIMLAELGVDYTLKPVDITAGAQHTPSFTAISPNGKIPALIDHNPAPGFCSYENSGEQKGEPLAIFESAAILIYLAEKFDRLMPDNPREHLECIQWLFWQMGGLGPMAGQAHHFRLYAPEKISYAIERYTRECERLYGVLDNRLSMKASGYICNSYSIADIAVLPWIFRHERQGQDLAKFPRLNAWYETMMLRPAVKSGLQVAADLRDDAAFTSDRARQTLFNSPPKEAQ